MAASMGRCFDVARSRQDLRVYIGTWQRHGVRSVATVRGTVLSALAIVVCVTSVSNHDTAASGSPPWNAHNPGGGCLFSLEWPTSLSLLPFCVFCCCLGRNQGRNEPIFVLLSTEVITSHPTSCSVIHAVACDCERHRVERKRFVVVMFFCFFICFSLFLLWSMRTGLFSE